MPRAPKYSWQQNLRLLADEGHAIQRHGFDEWQQLLRKELAARLGVSTRTLRRWLNEGATPSPANQQRIQRLGAGRRRAMKRAGYPDMPRIPYGHRRRLKRWSYDFRGNAIWDGTYYSSEWLNYHVEDWTVSEIVGLLMRLQGYSNIVQLLYRINRGESRGTQGGTRPLYIDGMTPDDLAEFVESVIYQYSEDEDDDPNEIIWLGVMHKEIKATRYV